MVETKEEANLGEALQRLEFLCRRLWDSDSPAAIDLQAVIEEFRGAVCRSERTISALRQLHAELREATAQDLARAHTDEARALQLKLNGSEARLAAVETALAGKEERFRELLAQLSAKEAQNLEFHELSLKTAAAQDEARAQKMEAFYKQLSAKESELESRWEARHAALEAENRQRVESFKKRQEELLAQIQSRAAAMEEHYLKRGEGLVPRPHEQVGNMS